MYIRNILIHKSPSYSERLFTLNLYQFHKFTKDLKEFEFSSRVYIPSCELRFTCYTLHASKNLNKNPFLAPARRDFCKLKHLGTRTTRCSREEVEHSNRTFSSSSRPLFQTIFVSSSIGVSDKIKGAVSNFSVIITPFIPMPESFEYG